MMKSFAVSTVVVFLTVLVVTVAISDDPSTSSTGNSTLVTSNTTSTNASASTSTNSSDSKPSNASSSESTGVTPSSIRILLTSDLEYNIFPVHSDNHSLCYDINTVKDQSAAECVGGLSRLMGYLKRTTEQFDLAVDAGNIAGGTYFPQLKYNPLTHVIELLNFTAVAVDAELLMYGADAAHHGFLRSPVQNAVAANLDMGSSEVAKSKSVSWNKRCDVAIIGLVSRSRVEVLSAPGVNASDEVSAVEQELKILTNQSLEAEKLITIVTGNIDESTAEAIANITGVNMVIVSGTNVSASETNITKLSSIAEHGNAYIVKLLRSSHFPFTLASLELTMAQSGCNITGVNMDPVDYSAENQTDDEAVRALEKEGMARLRQMTSSRLVESIATIPSAGCDTGECALGNLVADAVVNQLMVQEQGAPRLAVFPGHRFNNNSRLSADIVGTAVDSLFKRDEFLYTLYLSAPQLKSLLEESVSSVNDSSFLQISALMNLQLDLGQPEDSRVASVHVVRGDDVTFSLVNLTDSTANYSVAAPASMLQSYSTLHDIPSAFHMLSVSEAVKYHLLRAGVLVVPPAGRRVTYITDVSTSTPATSPTPAPTLSPVVVPCSDNTATTVIVTLIVTAVCVAGASLFWVYAMPRIRLYRARRDSSLPLVVQY